MKKQKAEKVNSKILCIIRFNLSSEFRGGMHSLLDSKELSKINIKVKEFTGKILEFITKIENVDKLFYFLKTFILCVVLYMLSKLLQLL